MENWKHVGTLLAGIAALITASIPIASCFKDLQNTNFARIKDIRKETTSNQYALINDPDGWVNLRTEPNFKTSKIITRIENGYRVQILEKNSNWYKVKTYIDDIGYIYSDRLILQK